MKGVAASAHAREGVDYPTTGLESTKAVANRPELRALLASGQAESTKAKYAQSLRFVREWYQLRYQRPLDLPLSEETILDFVVDLAGGIPIGVDRDLVRRGVKRRLGPIAVNTLKLHLRAVSSHHQENGFENPASTPLVRRALSAAKKTELRTRGRAQKRAITAEILMAMIAACDSSLIGVRDRALLLVAFSSGGRRRSELVRITTDDLSRTEGGYLVTLISHKTSAVAGEGVVPVLGMAADALDQWISVARITCGSVFRSITKGRGVGRSLSDRSVHSIVSRRLREAGFDPREFSAHSIRSGFLTQSAMAGVSLPEAMQLSLHLSPAIAAGYYRGGMLLRNRAAHLLPQSVG